MSIFPRSLRATFFKVDGCAFRFWPFTYKERTLAKKDDENIKDLSEQITKLGGKPNLDESNQKDLIKNLTKQLETLSVNSILNDKSKNIIKDQDINGIKLRLQKVDDLPPKELRKLVDQGKKDLSEGIVVVFASKDDKVGIAVGVTESLTNKYDACLLYTSPSPRDEL